MHLHAGRAEPWQEGHVPLLFPSPSIPWTSLELSPGTVCAAVSASGWVALTMPSGFLHLGLWSLLFPVNIVKRLRQAPPVLLAAASNMVWVSRDGALAE